MPFDVYLLYASVGIVCALIIAIIRNRVMCTVFKETVDRRLCRILMFFLLFCMVDAAWGIIGSDVFMINRRHRLLYVISSYSFHIMAAWSSFMCSYYSEGYMELTGKRKRLIQIVRTALILIQIVFILQNIFTDLFFTVGTAGDDLGIYHSGPMRVYAFYLQFCQYIPLFICALIGLLKHRRKTGIYGSNLVFISIPILFGVLQMFYPDGSFYSLGFTAFSVAVYAFTVTSQREEFMVKYYQAEEHEKNRKEIEDALKKAEAASEAKTAFLSNMSHDIRTPINGIMGMVHIAQKEEMSPKVKECIGKIDGAARHLLMLINDVLDMSRIESGATVIAHNPMNLRMVADNCRSIILGQLEGRNITFECRTEDVEHDRVMGDELRLRQILINILGNAVKFTPDGGRITFEAKEIAAEGDTVRVRFTVKDTGIGMKPEFIPHIFDNFAQEEGGMRTNYKGTGLGMPIVKQLTELMNGTVEVESVLNEGSCFTVTIPFDVDHSDAPLYEAKVEKNDIKGRHVLLVEDNELNAEVATTLLKENGLNVSHAENGEVAVRMFSENPPGTYDVILMDIMMPVLNGLDATRKLRALEREDARSIPIIAMTANAFDEDKRNAYEAGMDGHVAKPIDFNLLFSEINRMVNGK